MQITTIGIDLAKTVFQIHAVDADGATGRPCCTPEDQAFYKDMPPRLGVAPFADAPRPRESDRRENLRLPAIEHAPGWKWPNVRWRATRRAVASTWCWRSKASSKEARMLRVDLPIDHRLSMAAAKRSRAAADTAFSVHMPP